MDGQLLVRSMAISERWDFIQVSLFSQPPSLYTVKGIAILDNDGNRILSNYYDSELFASIKEEKAFEKNLFSKTSKASGEIIMLDGLTCLYRSNVDLYFYVMGSTHENELGCKFLKHFW